MTSRGRRRPCVYGVLRKRGAVKLNEIYDKMITLSDVVPGAMGEKQVRRRWYKMMVGGKVVVLWRAQLGRRCGKKKMREAGHDDRTFGSG